MWNLIRKPTQNGVLKETAGAVAVEYALLGAFLGIGLLAALNGVRRNTGATYDTITYGLSQAAKGNAPAKVIARTVDGGTYTDSGRPVSRQYVYYTDGSYDLVTTGNWFQKGISNFDANGVQTGGLFIDANGGLTQNVYTQLTPTSQMIQQTGNASCNCTYRTAWTYDPQPDGSNNVVYRNTLVDGTNAATWMYQSAVFVFNSSPSAYNYIGDVQTLRNGQVISNGSSIAKYQ